MLSGYHYSRTYLSIRYQNLFLAYKRNKFQIALELYSRICYNEVDRKEDDV